MDQKVIDNMTENGVKNLMKFGYPSVNKDNIFTDMIYGAFFKRMLNDAKGNGFDQEIEFLLSKIETELQ